MSTNTPYDIVNALIKFKGSSTGHQILRAVERYTYGSNKLDHECAEEFLALVTGRHKDSIRRELKELIRRRILIEVSKPAQHKPRVLKFNDNVSEWLDQQSVQNDLEDQSSHHNKIYINKDENIILSNGEDRAIEKEIGASGDDQSAHSEDVYYQKKRLIASQQYKNELIARFKLNEESLQKYFIEIETWIQKRKVTKQIDLKKTIENWLSNAQAWAKPAKKTGRVYHCATQPWADQPVVAVAA